MRLVRPDFALTEQNPAAVAELCRGLGGSPLAIELAAARASALPVGQIAARLDDHLRLLGGADRTAPARQRSLRATLDWSHALLGPPERALFRRLAVFAGAWTFPAAEAVCAGGDVDPVDALDGLVGLVEKSLVAATNPDAQEGRYRLPEPVRQYAAERLAQSGEADVVRHRHACFYAELADAAKGGLLGPDQGAWLRRLDRDHNDLRVALGWWAGHDRGRCCRMAGALGRFWAVRGHLTEGRSWLARHAEAAEAAAADRVDALYWAGDPRVPAG